MGRRHQSLHYRKQTGRRRSAAQPVSACATPSTLRRLTDPKFGIVARKTFVAENYAQVMGDEPGTSTSGGGDSTEGIASFIAHVAPGGPSAQSRHALARFAKTGETERAEYRLIGDDGGSAGSKSLPSRK